MDEFWRNLNHDLPSTAQFLEATFRMVLAALLGGLIGLEREHAGQAAGLRTHMLVALGTAMFVVTAHETGASAADMSRVIQGIATGIGFVGAGAILKMADRGQIRGLTTAASVWLTAAAGTAVGLGRLWVPLLGSVLAWLILAQLKRIESHVQPPTHKQDPNSDRTQSTHPE
jgi:putative Mg2+ transporter-C (MgtC) family protein